MPVRVTWTGLAEFKAALAGLPEALAGEADHLVQDHGNAAAVRIRTNYGAHVHTGKLQASVKVRHTRARYGARSTVSTTAPHAHLFEFGTAARQTSQGEYRGFMRPAPPLHAFLPTVRSEQRALLSDLVALLERAGFVEVRADGLA